MGDTSKLQIAIDKSLMGIIDILFASLKSKMVPGTYHDELLYKNGPIIQFFVKEKEELN